MTFAFVIGAGEGDVGEQASLCVRSLRYFHPDVPIYVGCPPDENVPQEVSNQATTIFDVPIPLSEYPISHKVATLATVQEHTNNECYVLLDADTVLVDEFLLPCFEGVAACPEHYVAKHWTKRSLDDWCSLASSYGFEVPDKRVVAPMNNREMPPYYNAGVVLVTEDGFGKTWLDLTLELYQDEIPHRRFSDQVALGLLSFERDTTSLPMVYNWPVDAHIPWITDAMILHYHQPLWLLSAIDKQDILHELDATNRIPYGYRDLRFPIFAIRMGIKHGLFLRASGHGVVTFGIKRRIKHRIRVGAKNTIRAFSNYLFR